ncbi:MAG TPA: ABC transporter permease [Vicinamibacterales bacterium]|nr:ABC transporter permease [Vicinamibacterales bacterium]
MTRDQPHVDRRSWRLAGRLARLYPSRAGDQLEIQEFLADALMDARSTRGVMGVIGWALTTSSDLGRAWLGRGVPPLPPTLVDPVHGSRSRSSFMDRWLAELRYSLRVLARTPGFTFVAVLTLALGIGAATAVYAVADGAILRPFPYPDMDRIMLLGEVGPHGQPMSVSWPDFQDWQAQNEAFAEIGLYRNQTVNLTGAGDPERLNGSLASSGVFSATGIPPLMGQVFGAADDAPGASHTAIISERLWRTHFSARPDMVGQIVTFDNEPYTIAAVMPARMRFPGRTIDVWLPLGLSVSRFPPRGAHPGLQAIGRVKPGVSVEQARTAMSAIARRLAEQYPDSNKGTSVSVSPYYEQIVQNIRPVLYVLLSAVALLLIIACTNLASLMLARAESRHREFAVRAALGATRSRMLRQVLLEAAILAGAGGALGLGLATLALRAFTAMRPTTVPRIDLLAIDWRVAAFALGLTALTVALFALLPAMRASSPDLQVSLKDARTSGGRRTVHLRRGLVAAQVAVAAVLLVGAGLVLKSLDRLMSIELGFDPTQVVTMRLSLPNAAYPTPEAWIQFHVALLDRLQGTPGVEALGLNSAVPLEGGGSESPIIKEGDPMPTADHPPAMCTFQATGGDYFKAMGIAVIAGRAFDNRDTTTSPPVAILDESAVAKVFSGQNPVGRRIAFEFTEHQGPASMTAERSLWREVVGVVRHVKHYGLIGEPPYVQVYAPLTQLPVWNRERRPAMALLARTANADTLVPTLRRAVTALDPRLPVYGVQTVSEYVEQQTEQPRMSATLLGGFAILALVLAAIGVYGVLSYIVTQRTREIGVRLALGASRGEIVRQIVGQALALAAIGLAVGLAGAVALTRVLRTMLFEVSPTDIGTFATVAVVLGVIAVAAGLIPAKRASRVDPLVALRSE